MLDIEGFLLSTEFVAQLATLIAAVLAAIVSGFIMGFFGTA